MTPKRKAALQWLHKNPDKRFWGTDITDRMMRLMEKDDQIEPDPYVYGLYSLTDKGRQDLHEAGQ